MRDTKRMQEALAEHLRWADGGAVEVRSCDLSYFHETPTRCLLHYDLVVRDPQTGRDRPELVTGFISGEDRAEQVARQIAQTAPPPVPGRLVSVVPVPALDLVLQVFPFDQRLPVLHRLMTASAPRVAAAILADLGAGEWQVTGWEAEALRYRIDQRAMVRITLTAGDRSSGASQTRRVYAKVFRESADGARAYAVQEALWRRVAGRTEAFTVARPIAYVEAAQSLLLDEVAGTNLRHVLATADAPSAAVRQTARAVADLHRISPDEVDFGERRRPARNESDRLDKIAGALRVAVPAAGEIDAIVAAIAARMGESPVGLTHFDLKPGHILLDPPHITLLDFDKLAFADPLVDVANFLVFLGKERSDRSADRGEHDHIHHFLDEYLAHVPESWRSALPARYALALLSEAATGGRGFRGRGERGDRATTATALIEQAGQALRGEF